MAGSNRFSTSFLNLEPFSKAAKAHAPKAYKALFAPETRPDVRRRAFLSLLESIESDWIGAVPAAIRIPNRRRAMLALYALINGSPLDSGSDPDIERLIKTVLPIPNKKATHAIAEASARYAAM